MKRYVLVLEIKHEKLNDYIEAHMHMHESNFREQLTALRESGAMICDTYIYSNLAIVIYECDDINDSFTKLGNNPKRIEWENFTQPMFLNHPKFDGSVQVDGIEKIFCLNSQLDYGTIDPY